MATVSTSPSLLTLPRELRDMILSEVLTHRADIPENFSADFRHYYSYDTDFSRGIVDRKYLPDIKTALSLRLTCGQFKNEIDSLYTNSVPTASLHLYCSNKLDGLNVAMWPVWTRLPILHGGFVDLRIDLKLDMVGRVWSRDCIGVYCNFIRDYTHTGPVQAMKNGAGRSEMEFVQVDKLRTVDICISNVDPKDEFTAMALENSLRYFHWADRRHNLFKSLQASEVKVNEVVVWPVPDPDTRPPMRLDWN